MADDRERGSDERGSDEQEFKVTVRDRRRVTMEGDIREVEEEPTEAASSAHPEPSGPQVVPDDEDEGDEAPATAEARGDRLTPTAAERREARRQRKAEASSRRQGEARAQAEAGPRLQDADESYEEGEMPPVRDVYEYVQAVASEMMIWALSGLGLMPNPITRLITTDTAQARFAIDTAQVLIDHLVDEGRIDEETEIALSQSFVVQFGHVAAQLLSQPAETRLQEIGKTRFCIEVAREFVERLDDKGDAVDPIQRTEMARLVSELQLRFVQAAGGGGIIG